MEIRQTGRIASHISPKEIQEQRNRLLESQVFAHGQQLRNLLAFMVRHSLLTNHHRITQDLIARQVLQADDFNPLVDSSVRRLAARLRERLRDYYDDEGCADSIIITFPKGQPYHLIVARRHSFETVHPLNDRAFEEYQKGRSLWAERTPESLRAAMGCFHRAIELFPAYSRAHSALGECYSFMAIWGAPPGEVMPPAKAHALQALEIDGNNADAHALLGAVLSAYDWEWTAATQKFERALAIDDRNPGIYCWQASHMVSLGRLDEATHAVRLAQAAEYPTPSVVVNSHAAKVLMVAGYNGEAASLLARMHDANPAFYLTHYFLGVLHGIVGNSYIQAIESLERAAELSNQNSSVMSVLGSVYARAGQKVEAESAMEFLLSRQQKTYVPATELASLYWALGREDEAFEWLERAFGERSLFMSWLAAWPPLKGMAEDRRGKAVLRRMGLSE